MSTPTPDHRRKSDRRAEPTPSRRAPPESRFARWFGIAGRDVLIILGAVTAIVIAVFATKPVFVSSPKVVEGLTKGAPPAVAEVAKAAEKAVKIIETPTTDTTHRGRIVGTPEFERDRKAFADALVQTRRVPQARADSIAYYAVREAYVNQIPPAVVFGVMLTENSRFISHALSNVGAVGLMQVYPKVWLKALRGRFGGDIATDSTNIKYGTFILREYIKSDSGAVTPGVLSKGLLRYNGCVIGRNTPNCKTYPNKVAKHVEAAGRPLCGEKSFYVCIGRPFLAGLLGRNQADVQ